MSDSPALVDRDALAEAVRGQACPHRQPVCESKQWFVFALVSLTITVVWSSMSNEQRGVVFARVHVQQQGCVYARIRTRHDAQRHAGVPGRGGGVLGAPRTPCKAFEKNSKNHEISRFFVFFQIFCHAATLCSQGEAESTPAEQREACARVGTR